MITIGTADIVLIGAVVIANFLLGYWGRGLVESIKKKMGCRHDHLLYTEHSMSIRMCRKCGQISVLSPKSNKWMPGMTMNPQVIDKFHSDLVERGFAGIAMSIPDKIEGINKEPIPNPFPPGIVSIDYGPSCKRHIFIDGRCTTCGLIEGPYFSFPCEHEWTYDDPTSFRSCDICGQIEVEEHIAGETCWVVVEKGFLKAKVVSKDEDEG